MPSDVSQSRLQTRWGVILAGGEGVRLRPLTRRIAGDDRPKQFCPVLGKDTLLDQTRQRVARQLSMEQTLIVLVHSHQCFYAPSLADVPGRCLVVQPANRSTAPAILYALFRLASLAPMGQVAIFPSDHYISDDEAFMDHVETAFDAVVARPDLVTLLGITPDNPETAYGWIEPTDPVAGLGPDALFRVRRFWEKPSPALARHLLARACLWNSFVMVGQVQTLLALVRGALPDLYRRFVDIQPTLGTPMEERAVRALYDQLPPINFSRQVLGRRPANLAVLPVSKVGWTDLGESSRLLATLRRTGVRPAWICREQPA